MRTLRRLLATLAIALALVAGPAVVGQEVAQAAPATVGKRVATTLLNLWKSSTSSSWSGTVKARTVLKHTGVVKNGRLQVVRGGKVYWVTKKYTAAYAQWGTCGKKTLDGVTFAKKKIGASVSSLVTVNGTGGSRARVTLWTRDKGLACSFSKERQVSGRVGYGGIVADSKRKQDTGATPAGAYTMTQGFSNGSAPRTALSWRVTKSNHYWVQDNDSRYYNTYRVGTSGFDPKDAERLRDWPVEYRYSVVIDFNTAKVRKKGAGIFLHVNGDGATAGCVSVSKSMMIDIVHTVRPGDLIGIVK